MPKPDCQLLNVNVHGIKNDVRKMIWFYWFQGFSTDTTKVLGK